jgi:hypothetical protein
MRQVGPTRGVVDSLFANQQAPLRLMCCAKRFKLLDFLLTILPPTQYAFGGINHEEGFSHQQLYVALEGLLR